MANTTKNSLRIGIVMDPIESITIAKDSSFAMMLEIQRRGWEIFYILPQAMYVKAGIACATMHTIKVMDNPQQWFEYIATNDQPLHQLDAIIMRKDPPFNMEYVYNTYLLEMAESQGLKVINKPASIRSCNEKLFATHFPQFTPETLVSSEPERIKEFIAELGSIVVKPLDGMGGTMIFQIHHGDSNTNTILETITNYGQTTIMAQRFLPEFKEGDKRILLIDGVPFPHALARLPKAGESRANLAAGGTYKGVDLSAREWDICQSIGPQLKAMGLTFVGLDIIGDYITEINVTSPTCIRELDTIYSSNIAGLLMDAINAQIMST